MSDLTITHAGVSVTPSVKSGEFFTADRKLNQMRVSLIDAELTTTTSAIANNEVISQGIKIENAVSAKGGTGIIQSITSVSYTHLRAHETDS